MRTDRAGDGPLCRKKGQRAYAASTATSGIPCMAALEPRPRLSNAGVSSAGAYDVDPSVISPAWSRTLMTLCIHYASPVLTGTQGNGPCHAIMEHGVGLGARGT